MTGVDLPVKRCQVSEPLNLREALTALGIEHLEVTDQRTIAVYRQSVLKIMILEGTLSAAMRIEVELFDPPKAPVGDLASIVDQFIDEVTSAGKPRT